MENEPLVAIFQQTPRHTALVKKSASNFIKSTFNAQVAPCLPEVLQVRQQPELIRPSVRVYHVYIYDRLF